MYRASRSVLLAIWRSDSKFNHQIGFCGRGVLLNECILITVVYLCQKMHARMYFYVHAGTHAGAEQKLKLEKKGGN